MLPTGIPIAQSRSGGTVRVGFGGKRAELLPKDANALAPAEIPYLTLVRKVFLARVRESSTSCTPVLGTQLFHNQHNHIPYKQTHLDSQCCASDAASYNLQSLFLTWSCTSSSFLMGFKPLAVVRHIPSLSMPCQ